MASKRTHKPADENRPAGGHPPAGGHRPAGERRALAPGELARAPTYKLVVEYEGTRYSGWQEQNNAKTVAGVLRAAITEAAGEVLDLGGAGRTDAGVHALAQVAHLKLAEPMELSKLAVAVNERLPADVNLLAVARAPQRFHARHDAESRSYVYQISRRRSAFGNRFAWWVDDRLDTAAMSSALATLVGEHDFAPFGQETPGPTTTKVRVFRAELVESGSLVLLRFEASHFLWRMVRRLAGALVKVGTHAITKEQFASLLAGATLPAKFGTVAEWTAPAAGLFLERVRYAGDPALGVLAPAFGIDVTAPTGAAVRS